MLKNFAFLLKSTERKLSSHKLWKWEANEYNFLGDKKSDSKETEKIEIEREIKLCMGHSTAINADQWRNVIGTGD